MRIIVFYLIFILPAYALATENALSMKVQRCKEQKMIGPDHCGFAARDPRSEMPGNDILVDPNQVAYDEYDMDMWTTVAGLSWGTYRSTKPDLHDGAEILKHAREHHHMVRLRKLDGVGSQGTTEKADYPDAISIVETDELIPATSDAAAALQSVLEACERTAPKEYIGPYMRNLFEPPPEHITVDARNLVRPIRLERTTFSFGG